MTATEANKILKLSTEGEVLAEYPLPAPDSLPAGMVAGPDGAFWFIERGANQVGRITLDGGHHGVSNPNGRQRSDPPGGRAG